MRILHLASHLRPGGITSYVIGLSSRLTGRGHEVVVASGGGPLETTLAASGIAHWRLPLDTSAEVSLSVALAARRLRCRLDYDPVELIHAHTRVAQVVAEWLWRTRRIPYLTTWHGIYRARLGRRWWPCTGRLTIAISEPVALHLREVFDVPSSSIRVIPHGVDVGRFGEPPAPQELSLLRAKWRLPEDQPVVGTIARLVPEKDVDELVSAWAQVMAQHPNAVLVVVGEGRQRRQLERLAMRLGVAESVRFVGAVPETRQALSLMSVFVFLPTSQEGLGLVFLEAMASARAIVSVRRGRSGATWLIEDSGAGVSVEGGQPARLAASIGRLLDDPAEAARLGQQARRAAVARYGLEDMVTDTEQAYRECLEVASRR